MAVKYYKNQIIYVGDIRVWICVIFLGQGVHRFSIPHDWLIINSEPCMLKLNISHLLQFYSNYWLRMDCK